MPTKSKKELQLRKNWSIRQGTEEDILLIKPYLLDSWVMHARNEPKLLDEDRMKKSDIEKYYKDALKNKDSHFLIAEVDGQIVGFIRVDVKTIESFFRDSKILYLDDVYVVKAFRRSGVARALIGEAHKIAKSENIKRLQARVYTFNKPMQNLLISMGYTMPHSTWDKVID
jgi:GNAT superfamily N-acetyltransferase